MIPVRPSSSSYRSTHFPPILIFLIALALLGFGFMFGQTTKLPSIGSVSGSLEVSPNPSTSSVSGFNLFWQAWDKLHAQYVGELNDETLIEGAIDGMVRAVGDPYTTYLDPEAAKELGQGLQGIFSGIGAEIAVRDQKLVIIAPLADSPADRAGLKPQDEIQKIDGAQVGDLSLDEAVRRIRGEEGTIVTLTIAREDTNPQDIAVTRGQIVVKSVETELLSQNTIGYMRVTGFHNDTTKLAAAALAEFQAKQVRGVVLDLRGNPGGLLNEGVSLTNLFISSGVVVKQKAKDGQLKTYEATKPAKLETLPLVVLVDKGSASASEIVAGALQDHERAKLIGETTFGKGSVQELINLANGGQLKITIAQWLTPKDRLINGIGIEPDIVVSISDDDQTADRDPQLDRALLELSKSSS